MTELAVSGKCGVFLRVTEGGEIWPGDIALQEKNGPDAMSAADITRLACGTSLRSQSVMNLQLKDENLLRMNRLKFAKKMNKINEKSIFKECQRKRWRTFKVSRTVKETTDTKSFYLVPADGEVLPTSLSRHFFTVKLPQWAGTVLVAYRSSQDE